MVATSYESGIKELSQEFRNRLQEEMTQVDQHNNDADDSLDNHPLMIMIIMMIPLIIKIIAIIKIFRGKRRRSSWSVRTMRSD